MITKNKAKYTLTFPVNIIPIVAGKLLYIVALPLFYNKSKMSVYEVIISID